MTKNPRTSKTLTLNRWIVCLRQDISINRMKVIITFLIVLNSFMGFSQVTTGDSNQICLPYTIGRQILLDLNELDRLREESKLTKLEIVELEKKSIKQDGIIDVLEEKDSNNVEIIKMTEDKFKIVNTENEKLRDDIRKLKTKTTIIEIVGTAILTSITYIFIFK